MHPITHIVLSVSAALFLSGATVHGAQSIGGFNIYYGDLHNHCNVDDGGHAVGTPDEAFSYARTTAGMDFFGLAPHDLYITSSEWTAIGVAADAATVDGAFIGFRGFEWTTTPLGHIAIINSSDYCTSTQSATNTFAEICSWIDARSDCIAFLNHPGRQDATGAEFDHLNLVPASNVVGIELWNKTDPFSVYYYNDGYTANDNNKSYFDEAISKGWRTGAAGGGDNHSGTWGTATPARLAILANNLTRTDLLTALQARRFFSTLDKNIALSFSIDGNPMGSTITGANGQTLQILASDGDGELFTQIIVFDRNHNTVIARTVNSAPVNETVTLNTFDGDYYYVKVTQADGDEAISSAIKISGGQINTPPVCTLTAPLGNETYIAPAQVLLAAEAVDEGAITKVEFYAGTTKIGEDLFSPYEITWNNAAAGTYSITASAFDDGGLVTKSSAVSLTITPAAGTFIVDRRVAASSDDAEENTATGAVDVTSSSDLELVYDPGLSRNQLVGIRFTGCAIQPNATILSSYIQFTCKETGSTASNLEIRTDMSSNPLSFSTTTYDLSSRTKSLSMVPWSASSWTTVGASATNERTPDLSTILQEVVNSASYNASNALAFYFSGTGTRCAYSYSGSASNAALLHVEYSTLPPVNTPPVCAVSSPAHGTSYVGTTDISVDATATDAVGVVTNVEFLLNGLAVGQDTLAPCACLIPGLETGSYQLAVRATDDSGAVTTSAPVTIYIRDQNLLPACSVLSPANNAVFTAPATITITADASDADGSIAYVEFFSDNVRIGEDASAPFSISLTNIAEGSYVLTAVATDNNGGLTTSEPLTITVNPSPTPVTISQRIATGNDDVEEYSRGTMVLNHALELVYASKTTGNQTIGLRYTGISILQGATITSATIQFTANATKNGTTSVTIRGEKSVNAPAFTSGTRNVSNRTKTAASVSWSIPSWSNGASGNAQKTPDLKSIVQEIVNTGTTSSLVFIINGSGTKTAGAYETSAATAPLLFIQYTTP